MGKMMSPTAIFYMIIIGCAILYMVNQLLKFYGKDMQAYYIYTAFFTFILFSTAILDLQEPSLELDIGPATYENLE